MHSERTWRSHHKPCSTERLNSSTSLRRVWSPMGGYGSADMIEWLVDERGIEPHVKLMEIRTHGQDLLAQRLRLRSGSQPLCLPRRQRAKEIPPRFLQATPGADEGRNADLLRQQARLRGLRAQAHMLPERTRTQDRALGPRSCSRQGARNCKDRGLRCLTPPTKEG